MSFDGLNLHLGNLARLSSAKSRSISAENPTGEPGKGAMAGPESNSASRDLGRGWKCRPCLRIEPGDTATLADIEGPGAIQSMWFTGTINRDVILRIFWDDQDQPSVEVPISDFFAMPWAWTPKMHHPRPPYPRVNSLPVMVAPLNGCNCFWQMPFRGRCRITLENLHPEDQATAFHQINYTLTDVPQDSAYFHAQFRRVNPTPYKQEYVILDDVASRGHYVGTSMGWGINNNGWWGEGEIKFFMDGDTEFPTICGTGTEDYFGGSYNWDVNGQYQTYTTPYLGMHQVIQPDGTYLSQHRHAMYRWHVQDPIRFEKEIRVQMQILGWRSEGRYLPGQHDVSSVAYWYQVLPTGKFPTLPDRDGLEIL